MCNPLGTYKIIATSWVLWIPTLLITLLSGGLLLHELLPKNSTFSILWIVGWMAFALYIQRYISRAEVEIRLSEDNLTIRWLKQFIFHKRSDMEISFSDIESYKYQEDTNFDLFKLTLKDGTELKFWHFNFTHRDDFQKLLCDFPTKVARHNKKIERKSERIDTNKISEKAETIIKKEKTIFEGAYAPLLAGFAILLLIAVPLSLFIKAEGKTSNPLMGFAAMFGGLFFLIQYLKHRKKNKTEQP